MTIKSLLLKSLVTVSFGLIISYSLNAQEIPVPRWGHSMVAIDGELYVFGGATTLNPLYVNKLWRLDPSAGWQKEEPTNPPPVRNSHESVVIAEKMFTLFGQNNDGLLNDVWEYDPTTKTWTELPQNGAEKPVARKDFSAVAYGNGIIVSCGVNANGDYLSDNWYYSLETNIWEKKSDFYPSHSPYGSTSQMIGDKLYLFGGKIGGSNFFSTDVTPYDFLSDQLSFLTFTDYNADYVGMSNGMSCQYEDQTILFGGGQINQPEPGIGGFWFFNPQTTELTAVPQGPNLYHSAMTQLGDDVYVFAGVTPKDGNPLKNDPRITDPNVELTNALYKFNRDSMLWTEIDFSSGIGERYEVHNLLKIKAYPNPFSSNTQIEYTLARTTIVELTIYNSIGSQIAVLNSGIQLPGTYTYKWGKKQLASGLYYCVIQTDEASEVLKVLKQH